MEKLFHSIKPIYNENSKVLVLGTFPSPKSREQGFYYGHPQNRFWRVLSAVLKAETPLTIEQKKSLLLKHGIALWDVLESCEISGAADSSIASPKVNDFSRITSIADIKATFTTGKKATELFEKLTGSKSIYLPSTSPANCAMSIEKLAEQYKVLLEYIN